MKSAKFDYTRPHDVRAAIHALADALGEAKFLAGGQSLGPMLNLRLTRPKLLVDVSRIEALRSIDVVNGSIRIGAAVTHAEIEDAGASLARNAMLPAVAREIAYRTIRNRGTIGGSLAHADPAADWPLALAALDAVIIVNGPAGQRSIPSARFMLAAFTTQLADDEMIEAIIVPELSPSARWGTYKFCKRTGEFPDAAAMAVFDPARRIARVYVGALSGAPVPLDALARGIAQQGAVALTATAVDRAIAMAVPELDAVGRKMHAATTMRAVQQALAS
ncbi:MAG: carbon monoxide dehydrogenase [Betaproteobacteria bacterium]|nr:carbon monoxide dehydrogenase [Betaproteobacteria bacterium]